MQDRAKEVGRYLRGKGFGPYSAHELRAASYAYGQQLLRGLYNESDGLPMYQTHLRPVDLSRLRGGSEALVIEVGGTNIYSGRVRVSGGSVELVESQMYPLQRIVFDSADDFYHAVSKNVAPSVNFKPDALGVVYSFPGESFKTEFGVDVNSAIDLPKGFVIPGIGLKPVGESLRERLSQDFGIPISIPVVVTNDTPAVLLAGGGKIGGVVGTGFNIAVATGRGIVNTESGSFNGVPKRHAYAEQVDTASENPGKQLAEKGISGLYLGRMFSAVVSDLKSKSKLPPFLGNSLSSEDLSAVLDGYPGVLKRYGEHNINAEDIAILNRVASVLRHRSAAMVGMMIGTAIKTFDGQFPEQKVLTPIEGSVFWGVPEYRTIVSFFAREFSGRELEFVDIKNAGLKGAGAAALQLAPQIA